MHTWAWNAWTLNLNTYLGLKCLMPEHGLERIPGHDLPEHGLVCIPGPEMPKHWTWMHTWAWNAWTLDLYVCITGPEMPEHWTWMHTWAWNVWTLDIPGPEMHSEHSSCFRQELNRKQEKGNTSSLSYLKDNHCYMHTLSKNLKGLNRRKVLCLDNPLKANITLITVPIVFGLLKQADL
jgi:hypothetical protein